MGLNTFPCNPYPIRTEELHKGDNEDLQAQINAIKDGTDIDSFGDVETALRVVTGDITNLGTSKAAKADIAPTFSAEGNYAVGDLVYYDGVLYECTTAHEAAAWDAEDFTATSVNEELSAINSNLNSKTNIAYWGSHTVNANDSVTIQLPLTTNNAYLVSAVGNYPSNDSGTWLVYDGISVAGRRITSIGTPTGLTLTGDTSGLTLTNTSPNNDSIVLQVITV